jgi:protein SCO1/2
MRGLLISPKGLLIGFVAMMAAGLSIFFFFPSSNGLVNSNSKALAENYTGFNFTLRDHLGLETRLSDFQGRVVLLFFGYTFCPDICPTQLSLLKEVMDKLGELSGEVQVLFITVDPERDTPAVLREYLANFHPGFLGLTGPVKEIQRVARQYSAAFSKGEILSQGYKMDHSSSLYLINQKGRLAGVYPGDTAPERMMDEIIKTVDSRGVK